MDLLQVLRDDLFYYLMFIYFERERECEWGEGRKRERIPSRLHGVSSEPATGFELMNHEIVS